MCHSAMGGTASWYKTAFFYIFLIIICPIAIARNGRDYEIVLRVSVHLCVCRRSVCLHSLSRSHFLVDFHEKWHEGETQKVRTSLLGVNMGPPPIMTQQLPQKGPAGIDIFGPNHQMRNITMSRTHQTGSWRQWYRSYSPSRRLCGWSKIGE